MEEFIREFSDGVKIFSSVFVRFEDVVLFEIVQSFTLRDQFKSQCLRKLILIDEAVYLLSAALASAHAVFNKKERPPCQTNSAENPKGFQSESLREPNAVVSIILFAKGSFMR